MTMPTERLLVTLPRTLFFSPWNCDPDMDTPSVDIFGKEPTEIADLFKTARKVVGAQPYVWCR